MAATIKNTLIAGQAVVPTLVTKLTRGKPINLGTLAAANDVVTFTLPEPSRDHQGNVVFQVSSGITGGTFKLEASLDGGTSWFDVPLPTASTTADFGDPAATAGFGPVNLSGFGSGATFRFGLSATTSGSAAAWALVG